MRPAKKWVLTAGGALLCLVITVGMLLLLPSRVTYLDTRVESFHAKIVTHEKGTLYCGNQNEGRFREALRWLGFSTPVAPKMVVPVKPGSCGFMVDCAIRLDRDPEADPRAELRDASGTVIPLRYAGGQRGWNLTTHQAVFTGAWVLDEPPSRKSDYVFKLMTPDSGARLMEIRLGMLH